MGILDDAIREHLELKRSHGATEDEVRQKEVEVFGQMRTEAPPAPVADTEHTELLTPDAPADAAPAPAEFAEPAPVAETHFAEPAPAELDPLQPAAEDPYAVHPGDTPVPDEQAPQPTSFEEPHVSPAAEAGAGMLEPHRVEPGPPTPPEHHHDEQHPALADHDHIHSEEHAPEPVFRRTEEPQLEPAPVDDPPVGDPPPEEQEGPPAHTAEGEGGEEGEELLEETPEFLQDAPEHDRLWFEQKPPRDFDFGE